MSEEEILHILRTRLTLRVVSGSTYTGGLDGSGNLYRDTNDIQLCLDDEIGRAHV